MDFRAPKRINLKDHPTLNEKWLQERLAENTSLLGLGELEVRDVERVQPRAGRLDLLLSDPETLTRYEVEIQLGATDESHIIRTIEYWDLEKRRYPQYEHIAVIVAEDVTSRFLNVLSLFNGFIPIVAIQIQAVEIGGAFTLVATRVLDRMVLGTEEDDEGETVDRSYWEQKSSVGSLALVDQIAEMVKKIEPDLEPKYNKHYVGLANRGVARNFVAFRPRRQHIIAEFKIPRDDELTEHLEEEGLDVLPYDSRWNNFRLRIGPSHLDEHRTEIEALVERARDAYGN